MNNSGPNSGFCADCGYSPCACRLVNNEPVLMTRVAGAEQREREAVAEAYKYRELWEAAASCLQHNRKKISAPRGEDERRMLDAAEACMCGHFWSGATNGWLPEAEQMGLFESAIERCAL